MIKGISSGLMLSLHKYGGSKNINLNDVFAGISVAIGGDGKTIKKEQLEKFIKDSDNGVLKVSPKQLKAFKQLYASWDKIFEDKDEIDVKDFEKVVGLFKDVIINDKDDENVEFMKKLQEKNKKYLEDLSKKLNGDKDKKPTIEQLKEYLSELIQKNDDNDAEEIAHVINIIEEMKTPTENEYSI